jgi:WD40 repeat protein
MERATGRRCEPKSGCGVQMNIFDAPSKAHGLTTLAIALALAVPLMSAPPVDAEGGAPGDLLEEVKGLACMLPPVQELLCNPGAEAWVNRYDGQAGGHDYASRVGVSPDGTRVYVTGQSPGLGSGADYATLAYDVLLGTRLWEARHNGDASGFDTARDLAVGPDGLTVYVTGTTREPGGDDITTIAYDALTGAVSWTSRFDRGGEQAEAVAVSPDGSMVFATGVSNNDFVVVAYDAEDGSEAWRAFYSGPIGGYGSTKAIAVSGDSTRVFVTGFSPDAGTQEDYVTLAMDTADGSRVWEARYDGPASGSDIAFSIDLSPDGSRVLVTGLSPGIGTGVADYATVAYNSADGSTAWVARYDGPANAYDVGASVAVDPASARVFVTGFSTGVGTNFDYATIAYDLADGSELWEVRYTTNGRDAANDLAISPDGATVYVTGSTGQAPQGNDFVTIAYAAADGTERWRAVYDGPGVGDIGNAVAASPNGSRVFVAGISQGLTGSWDYAVVAYQTG